MDASHAQGEGDDGEGGNLVLKKETLGADKAASDAQADHDGAKRRHPPADEQGGLVVAKGQQAGRVRVKRHGVGKGAAPAVPPGRMRRARWEGEEVSE